MLVAGVGTVDPPIRIDEQKQIATFTLKVDDDRYFISTIGIGQFERMAESPDIPHKMFVMGYTFTFKNKKCGNHHVGINPLILHPLEGLSQADLELFQNIASQWFTAALLNLSKTIRLTPQVPRNRVDNKPR
jgi:hypothetical protein